MLNKNLKKKSITLLSNGQEMFDKRFLNYCTKSFFFTPTLSNTNLAIYSGNFCND